MTVFTDYRRTPQPATKSMLTAALFTTAVLAASAGHAAPEITINPSATGSTAIVEQSADGQVATITATPNGISMRNGMPYAVTNVTTIPRYRINQGTTTVTTMPTTSATTQVGVTQIGATPNTQVSVINAPVTTQTLPVTTVTSEPVLTTPTVTTVTNPAVTTVSLDTLQLQPTFSTPDLVSANTKIMKIMKNSDGRDIAVPANHIAPGDVIEYRTTYINTSAQPISDLNATVTLPSGVKLVSLNSPLPTLATTGGNSYQTIQQMGNTTVIQENYSGLRWNLVNLDANTPQTVIMRAKVQ